MFNDAFLRPLHLQVVEYAPAILRMTTFLYIVLIMMLLLGLPLYILFPQHISLFLEVGKKSATLSLLFYGLSLLPGMLRRFTILPTTRIMSMMFRRQTGILMFFFMAIHSGYSQVFPMLSSGLSPLLGINIRILLGFIAGLVLIPLWMTANDYSIKKLGRTWHTLHLLTYIALFGIFGHILLLSSALGQKAIIVGIVILEVISWMYYWIRVRKSQTTTPTNPTSTLPV